MMKKPLVQKKVDVATFGAGCFWHVEEAFRTLKGVITTEVGFMGGKLRSPSYHRVCHGDTGHVEVVHITFNPKLISYKELLHVFWKIHNPTTYHRQGLDIGEQYKSVIFYHADEQKKLAEQSKKELNRSGIYSKPIVTEIVRAATFYSAEEYHQKYLMKRGLKTC